MEPNVPRCGIGAIDRKMRRHARGCASWRLFVRRFGYRRVHILLKREGLVMNHKKLVQRR